MQVTLQVRAFNNAPASDTQRQTFNQFPVVIGRSSACHYRLNDESRYISSRHATLTISDGQLFIQDTSSNGVFINGSAEPVGRDKTAMLQGDETLTIGDYQLSVVFAASPESDQTPVLNPFDNVFSPQTNQAHPSEADPFNGGDHDWTPPSEQADPNGDPFEDVWGKPVQHSASNTPPPPAKQVSDWPSDWDESKVGGQPAVDAASHASKSSTDWSDDEFDWASDTPSASSSASDAITVHNDPPPFPPDTYQHQGNDASGSNADPFAIPDWESITPAPPTQPSPQRQAPQPPASSRPQSRRQVPSGNASIRQLLQAAGLNPDQYPTDDETAMMIQSGRVLSQSVDAMMLLLRSRTEMKNAIRSDVTMLSRSNNNPLKFSLTSSDALSRLLAADTDGFMNAEDAINEAVADLKLHQVAMLDGMKAAVKALLQQFDPEKLARKMEKKGGIGANIPITREAKLWELFCEHYDTITEEAVTDFDDLFGVEFRKAYEERIRKLGRNPEF